MTENKRFMLDDAGELIDLNNHKFIDYGEECCNLLNEQHEQIQELIQSSKELEEDCQSTFNAMSRKQDDLYRKNFKLKEENEQLEKENKELKNKLAKVEEILNNRLSNDFQPVWNDGKSELFIEEKVGYRRALKQLKKKLIRENIIEGDMND